MKLPTYAEIKPYIEKKLVSEQIHPEADWLRIFNYTQKCQFDSIWDDVTMQCRGLILDIRTDTVIARPFPKFFNYGEYVAKGWPLPKGQPVISEKYDGSLGILYQLNGNYYIATRGAFTSEQAIWATNWLRKNIGSALDNNGDALKIPLKSTTYLFEIIYPENRIVVNYDFQGLVFLAAIDTESGVQRKLEAVDWDGIYNVKLANIIPANDIEELANLDLPNSEGFVIYYPEENKRMKIKFPEYVRLHKLVTGVSEIAIWEHLREGKGLEDLLEKVPDEFFKWVQSVENRLRAEHAKLWGEAQHMNQMLAGMKSRKEQAQYIMKNHKKVSGVIFSLLDGEGEKAADQVWKMVRPHGNTQFKIDTDL